MIVSPVAPAAGLAPGLPSLLGQVGWAFPEDGAVWGRDLDVAEPSGAVEKAKRDGSSPTEIVRVGNEPVAIELDADVRPSQGDLHLVPLERLDGAGSRLEKGTSAPRSRPSGEVGLVAGSAHTKQI